MPERVELSGPDQGPIGVKVEVADMTPEERQARLQQLWLEMAYRMGDTSMLPHTVAAVFPTTPGENVGALVRLRDECTRRLNNARRYGQADEVRRAEENARHWSGTPGAVEPEPELVVVDEEPVDAEVDFIREHFEQAG